MSYLIDRQTENAELDGLGREIGPEATVKVRTVYISEWEDVR